MLTATFPTPVCAAIHTSAALTATLPTPVRTATYAGAALTALSTPVHPVIHARAALPTPHTCTHCHICKCSVACQNNPACTKKCQSLQNVEAGH